MARPAISERTYKLIRKGLARGHRYVDIAYWTKTSVSTVSRVYHTNTYEDYLKGRKRPHAHWWNYIFG